MDCPARSRFARPLKWHGVTSKSRFTKPCGGTWTAFASGPRPSTPQLRDPCQTVLAGVGVSLEAFERNAAASLLPLTGAEAADLGVGTGNASLVYEIVLAQAFELCDNRAAEIFHTDYMPGVVATVPGWPASKVPIWSRISEPIWPCRATAGRQRSPITGVARS